MEFYTFFPQRTPATPAKKAKKTDDGEFKLDLGKSRQVTVRAFKGKTYIDIRYAINIFPSHLILFEMFGVMFQC